MALLYIPKKSRQIYEQKIAHRGYHYYYPENTLMAFYDAKEKNLAIECDIRYLRDGNIVCFHDRYTKTLLGIKGKMANMTLDKLKDKTVLESQCKVPTLEELLQLIQGSTVILIEVKGYLTNKYLSKLIEILDNYNGTYYFHAKNIFTYYKLVKIWQDKVFWVLNPFRKRFDFIKFRRKKFGVNNT